MKNIQNEKVSVFMALIGNRDNDGRDFEAFYNEFVRPDYQTIYVDYTGRTSHHFQRTIKKVEDLANISIKKDQKPLVIFPILTTVAAKEAKALIGCFKRLKAIRENVFVYPIIWDSYNDTYLYESGNAAHIFIDLNPSVDAERLNRYISRIMGYDLPDGSFPGYSQEDANKIARHINHESFNYLGKKPNSIPKYPIINCKPRLPTLYIKERCPHCRHENEIFRGWLDKDGNVKITCQGGDCCATIFLGGIGAKFDPWPEFDEYRKESD